MPDLQNREHDSDPRPHGPDGDGAPDLEGLRRLQAQHQSWLDAGKKAMAKALGPGSEQANKMLAAYRQGGGQ